MTEKFPRGRTAIVSTATYGMGEAPGLQSIDLLAHASIAALAKVGLTPADVDGVFTGMPFDLISGLSVPEYFGIHPRITDNNRTGGSAFQTLAIAAALALDAGLCDVALIAYGSNLRTGAGAISPPPPDPFEWAYKARYPISAYALAAARHMHEFGTTREQLAEVAVAARGWANRNPKAVKRGPLTIDDVLGARMVCDPLSVRDCCLVTDGGAAVVMTRADRARDLSARPAYLLAGAAATTHNRIAAMPDLTVTGAADTGPRVWAQSGYGPADMDALQLYDAFTINPILFLEDLGFCPKGEGGRFVSGGRIAPGGELPVNTNGGGLSCVHPGMYGLFALAEAADQLMGTAGAHQIDRAVDLSLAHGNGMLLSSQATVVLGSASTL
ncbi:acetyl-CoA acetyltransferase [Hephaestia caeni]|uniref:Acetyl-CoA acetyltransferase n=1 Tax=Hephaestia caeni TaxID=645617 RepID=A0A397NNF9_9SPHN|nr:acetyl-CoA acetyltransferase [Hephaestia caeni]RIA37149.1 acetyl-CoA acetyltransferase [Hephaestia caeni]